MKESKMGEREEWERFGYSNSTLRIDVSNEGGEDLFYTWEPRLKRDPSWMLFKCHLLRVIEHLKEGCTFWVLVV
jgi:hypothetical protein